MSRSPVLLSDFGAALANNREMLTVLEKVLRNEGAASTFLPYKSQFTAIKATSGEGQEEEVQYSRKMLSSFVLAITSAAVAPFSKSATMRFDATSPSVEVFLALLNDFDPEGKYTFSTKRYCLIEMF